MNPDLTKPPESQQQSRAYWWMVGAYFFLFSLGAIATCILPALMANKWENLTGQEKFMVCVAIFGNWTNLVLAILLRTLMRMGSGKAPIETGGTEHITR